MVRLELSERQLGYLRALARMNIRKQRKERDRFQPHAGQDPAEAAAVLKRFQSTLEFREDTYRALGGDPARIEPRGGEPA